MRSIIREVVDGLIAEVAPRGECDLVLDIARPLPFRVISRMLGYPAEGNEALLDWTDAYTHAGCGPDFITEEVVEAFSNFVMFHEETLEQKKRCPADDLLSVWLKAELDGEKLSEDKIMYEHNLLLVGGSETTRGAIALGMQELFRHPDQMAWLREHLDDDEAVVRAVEELIRWSCPFVRMRRTATQDVELHGQTIREGQEIIMLYPAANRDPRAFEDPDRFDVRRSTPHPSLSFGFGKHYCLGARLARLEVRIMLEALLARLPGLRARPDTPPVYARSCFVRGMTSFPVAFTAQT